MDEIKHELLEKKYCEQTGSSSTAWMRGKPDFQRSGDVGNIAAVGVVVLGFIMSQI